MKKLKIFAVIVFLLLVSTQISYAFDWYVYKGVIGTHSYSINFPSTWQIKIYGDMRQGFVNSTTSDDLLFQIDEFNGVNFQTALNYYINSEVKLDYTKDRIIRGKNEDMAVKEAYFTNTQTSETFSNIFIKRGRYIVSLSNKDDDISKNMIDSFSFTDNWKTVIDYKHKLAFSYPSFASIVKNDDLIKIDSLNFSLRIFNETSLIDAIEVFKGENRKLKSKSEIEFHNIENVVETEFLNLSTGTTTKVIFIDNNNSTFALTIDEYETYTAKYIDELLESFEFYQFEGDYIPYLYFNDVRDDHSNVSAVNYLASEGVINGYEDGTFRPDGEINRAELTKMVIESVANVDKNKYKNCFPDVNEEWFASYICFAKYKGWVSGYEDGEFKPGNMISRAEAFKIILEVIVGAHNINETEKLSDKSVLDISEEDWFYKYFTYISNRELADMKHIEVLDNGKYNFKFTENITRKEVAQVIYGLKDWL